MKRIELPGAFTLEELRISRDQAVEAGDRELALACAIAIDKRRGRYGSEKKSTMTTSFKIPVFVLLQFEIDNDDHTYCGKYIVTSATLDPEVAKKFIRKDKTKRSDQQNDVLTFMVDAPLPAGHQEVQPINELLGEAWVTIRYSRKQHTFEVINQLTGSQISNSTSLFTLLDAMKLRFVNNQMLKIKVYDGKNPPKKSSKHVKERKPTKSA